MFLLQVQGECGSCLQKERFLERFELRLCQQIYLLAMTTAKDCILQAAARCITFGLTPQRCNSPSIRLDRRKPRRLPKPSIVPNVVNVPTMPSWKEPSRL